MSVGAGNVSIVIPCYNQGATLREALASTEQARNEKLLEVIVVDDGSSEVETTTILSQVQEAGYCVVPQPNRGLAAARNAGIRRAKGEFILPLASMTELTPSFPHFNFEHGCGLGVLAVGKDQPEALKTSCKRQMRMSLRRVNCFLLWDASQAGLGMRR